MSTTLTVATASPRTVHVEHCMGTVFTIDIRDGGEWTTAINDVVDWLHHVDAVFSTYRPDSDISRIQRGEIVTAGADPSVATVLELCTEMQTATKGYFTTSLNGQLDPTGLVKGWAVEHASALLREHGSRNHAVNGGGDVQLAGEAAAGRAWTVGISDPHNSARIVGAVSGGDLAVATSGIAERGHHIVDPTTGQPAGKLASASVTGPSLTRADAYATAAFAMGEGALRWIDGIVDYEVLLVTRTGQLLSSPSWLTSR